MLFLLLFFMLILISSLLLLNSNSVFLWWAIFIFMTIIGTLLMKICGTSSHSLIVYFAYQEFGGLIFLYNYDLHFIVFSLLLKGGFPPFHSWMVSVLKDSSFDSFVWLMTIQKLPYYLLLGNMLTFYSSTLLVMLSWIPLYNVYYGNMSSWFVMFLMMSGSSNLMVVFNWLVPEKSFLFTLIYLLGLFLSMGWVNYLGVSTLSYELVVLLVGMPFTFPFFIKISVLFMTGVFNNVLLILFLITMVLYVLVGINLLSVTFLKLFPYEFSSMLFATIVVSFLLLLS